jgi:predicted GIY-YIG superfamily endonuclease
MTLPELLLLYPNLAKLGSLTTAFYLDRELDAYLLNRACDVIGIESIIKTSNHKLKRYRRLSVHWLLKEHWKKQNKTGVAPRGFYWVGDWSWCIYILVKQNNGLVKIGVSQNPAQRARRFNDFDCKGQSVFSLQSLVLHGYQDRRSAYEAETKLKKITKIWRPDSDLIGFLVDGITEWRVNSSDFNAVLHEWLASQPVSIIALQDYEAAHPRLTIFDIFSKTQPSASAEPRSLV